MIAMATTGRAGGNGTYASWDGGCLFIGRMGGHTPMHSHYAIQIAFGSEPGLRFRPAEREEWTDYDGIVIASRQPHEMDSTVPEINAILFVEPETREGRALAERFGGGLSPVAREPLGGVVAELFRVWRTERTAPALAAAARAVVVALTGGVEPSVVSDERILRAIAFINSRIATPLTLEAVAAEAFLSPSRFRHLFVEQTGMALRPYILWRRFLFVWELLMQGSSLSAAAHAAGFADAAHLTRTCRRTFGIAPSQMLMAGSAPRAESQPLHSTA